MIPDDDRQATAMNGANERADWLGLAGRVCAVTGAGSGIGAAIAEGLAGAGAHVVLLDRDGAAIGELAARLHARGARCLPIAVDVCDEHAVQRAADVVRTELGPCWGLANNAGILRPGGLADVALDEWNRVLAVNLTGYLLVARQFARHMRERATERLTTGSTTAGSIVHVASISAHHPQSRSGAYSASKAGVLLMSRQMAVEWGPEGIRSNAVCPGMIRTPLSARFYEEPGFEARRAAFTASRRIGEPTDVASAVMFLLSPRADYINGAELMVAWTTC
jgi:NAD(P)-dependent dehydrogenase (short-subunit alcohol dehydrogenase family)